ncbi:tetratricopeptide repeat protein [Methylophaga sp.]|uniref:tetratricopeptide repeat protein n=1 Tax=Methylophaga sp. TaxID=2024840 RepID=UPI002729290A|nr:tetratricopeptide repeat protein [Methylophaga sp.]MDO8825939.1 tetratricopeptide repeat protein [Methylophaga sp.]
MQKLVLLLLLSISLYGCSGSQSKENVAQLVDETEDLDHQSDVTKAKAAEKNRKKYDDELQALFAQPYIDPLTDYLNQYAADENRTGHLRKVRAEQESRCRNIAERYTSRPLTQESLILYKAGYNYSCPADVEAFALRVAEAEESQAIQSTLNTALISDISKKQLNDCYLLTTISNFREAKQACMAPANDGDIRSQLNMVAIHKALGEYTQALAWAKKAEPNSPRARYLIGEFYAAGQGVAQNHQTAFKWFEKAAEDGDADAQYKMAWSYETGTGVPKSNEKAMMWYQRAAANNNIPAKHALGVLLIQQSQNPSSVESGLNWLIQAVRAGDNESALLLGQIFQKSDLAEDKAQALIWYELAQKQGSAEAEALAESLRKQVAAEAISVARQQVNRILESQN